MLKRVVLETLVGLQNNMPKLEPIRIDLSGIGGLSPRYERGNPELKILALDNQYAGGFCNPIAKLGYMSPANSTTTSITPNYRTAILLYSYDNINYIPSENVISVDFKSDGTKMYISTITIVHQYSLSTAWDVSTATYDTKSLDMSGEDSAVNEIRFGDSGTKLYAAGDTNNKIFQYNLSSAWDISTASYASKFLDISGEEATISSLALSSTGTKAYIIGSTNNTVYQYDLSTPWDISSGSYASKFFDASSQAASAAGLLINSDDNKIYIIGDNDYVYQYVLSTARDISTTSYTGQFLDVSNEDTTPLSIVFGNNESQLFMGGNATDKIYSYSTPSTFSGLLRATQMDYDNTDYYAAFTDLTNDYGIVSRMSSLSGTTFEESIALDTDDDGITDLEIYEVNGIKKIFASYQKDTGADIAIITPESMYFDSDWLSTACSGGSTLGATNDIQMIVADNGFMYILDGSTLHKIDGTTNGGANGTATMNVLTFPALFQLIDAIDLRGNLWFALMKSTNDFSSLTLSTNIGEQYGGIYIWDRQSTIVNMTDFIRIEGITAIRAIFTFREVPGCITISSTGYTQLRLYNGNNFEIIKEMERDGYPIYRDSVNVNNDMISWIGRNGYHYRYGKIVPELEDALYIIGDASQDFTSFDYAGAMILSSTTSTGEAYSYGVRGDSTFSIKKWHPHYTTNQKPLVGSVYSKVFALPKLSKVKSVTLYYPPSASSGSTKALDLDIYFNQSTTSWGTTTLSRTDGVRSYKFIPVNKTGVNYIQFKSSWNTALDISSAIIPAYVEIEVETTGKKI